MIGFVYLTALLVSLGCMLVIDARFRLFFWRDAVAASVVTVVGTVFFLIWDAFGIGLGIFFRGENVISTGIVLAPEMPLEEPVFLVFLIVCIMVLTTGAERMLRARRARAGSGRGA